MGFFSKLLGSGFNAGPAREELTENTAILINKSIFAVDISITIREVIKLTFKPYDCRIILAESGQEALSCLAENRPDIVLLGMPLKNFPWSDMARMIKERYPDTPVILLKSPFTTCAREEADQEGICKIVEKPFDSNLLVNEVVKALGEKK
jgi:DNA-binding NtrC family response regulator